MFTYIEKISKIHIKEGKYRIGDIAAWAHDTYTTDGDYISHTDGTNAWEGTADVTAYLTSRYNCAGYMTQLILARASAGTDGSAERIL